MKVNKYISKKVWQILSLGYLFALLPFSLSASNEQPVIINNCSFNAELIINKQPDCNTANGSVCINVLGATGKVTYSWGTETCYNNLPEGNYCVYLTDENNCRDSVLFTLKEICDPKPCSLAAELVINRQPDCGVANGSVCINVTGATGKVTYSWGPKICYDKLSAGNYCVYITDENNCKDSVLFTLKEICDPKPCSLDAQLVINKQPDCGVANGSVCINVIGSTGKVTYSWGTETCYDNLPPGNYCVYITDENNCKDSVLFTLKEICDPKPCSLDAQLVINKQPDCGVANGSVCINVTGATGKVTYSWGTETCYDNLPPGNYCVYITDENNCKDSVLFTLKEICDPKPCSLDAQLVINKQPDCGVANGSVCIDVTGATGKVTYSWGTETCYDNLPPGNYCVYITDENNCKDSVLFTLKEICDPKPCSLDAQLVINKQPDCGVANGSVCINVTGAAGKVTYSWGTETCYDNLPPGNYCVYITDENNCKDSVLFTLKEECCTLIASCEVLKQPTCQGNDGSIRINVIGAEGAVTYSWGTEAQYDNLTPGVYIVTITDETGCEAIVNCSLEEPTSCCEIAATVEVIDQSTCPDKNDGSATITVTDAIGPFTYSSNWGTNATRTDLMPGSMTVTITDSLNCTTTVVVEIVDEDCQDPPIVCKIAATVEVTSQPTCPNKNDGVATITVTDAIGPFTYSSNWGTNATRTDLMPGSMTITITDSLKCITTVVVEIANKDCPMDCELVATVVDTIQPTCPNLNNGSATILVTGAQGAIIFSDNWGNSPTRNDLEPGLYVVIVSDAAGCKDTVDILMEGDATDCPSCFIAAIKSQTKADCKENNGTVNLGISGATNPLTFTWSDGVVTMDSTRSDLEKGTYMVTITEAITECEKILTVTITEKDCQTPPCFVASEKNITSVECDNDNYGIEIAVSGAIGPLQFIWPDTINMDSIRVGFSTGFYQVIVEDLGSLDDQGNPCRDTVDFGFPVVDCNCFEINTLSTINPECGQSNGAISITSSGFISIPNYRWEDDPTINSGERTDLPAGIYTVTITDRLSPLFVCTETLIITLEEECPPCFTSSLEVIQQPTCDTTDGSVLISTIDATMPLTFAWSDGVITMDSLRSDLGKGDYKVTITEEGTTCIDSLEFTLGPDGMVQIMVLPDTVCTNELGSITYNLMGCFTLPGELQLLDNNGILVATKLISSLNENGIFEDLVSGDYTIGLFDASLSRIAEEAVRVGQFPVINFTGSPSDSCDAKGAINLMVEGGNDGYRFEWSGPDSFMSTSNSPSDLSEGEYKVTITDNVGCKVDTMYTVKEANGPDISFEEPDPICFGDSLQLLVTNNRPDDLLDYEWTINSSNDFTISDSIITNPIVIANKPAKGVATVRVTNRENGCTTTSSQPVKMISIDPPLRDNLIFEANCENTTIDFINRNSISDVLWDFGDETTESDTSSMLNPSYMYPEKGEYIVTLSLPSNFKCSQPLERQVSRTIKVEDPIDVIAKLKLDFDPCEEGEQEMIFTNDSDVKIGEIDSLVWMIAGEEFINDKSVTSLVERPDSFRVSLMVFNETRMCTSTIDTIINLKEIPSLVEDLDACEGTTVNLIETLPANLGTYSWEENDYFEIDDQNPVFTLDSLEDFTAQVVKDGTSCTFVDIRVNVSELPEFVKRPDGGACDDNMQVLIGLESASTEAVWSTNPNFTDTLTTELNFLAGLGTYYVKLSEKACMVIDSVRVIDGQLEILIDEFNPECEQTMATLNLTNLSDTEIISYDWSPKNLIELGTETTATPVIMLEGTNTYTVDVENVYGCKATDAKELTKADTSSLSQFQLDVDKEFIARGNSVTFTISGLPTDGYIVEWTADPSSAPLPTSQAPFTVSPDETTIYSATIKDENTECSVGRNREVRVGCTEDDFFFPNTFSPNGDGVNDLLFIRGIEGYQEVELIIYNRWGEKVFETNNADIGWDGVFKGEPVCADVYGYYLAVSCPSSQIVKKGNITVLK